MPLLSMLGGRKARIAALPFAGGWTKYRDMPAPEGRTFMQAYAQRNTQKQGD
jgi:L-lactate dehydrogenase complex protein LldF